MLDWMFDHSGWMLIGFIALLIALIVYASNDIDKECDNMMKLAHSSHDTLEVKIACNQMHNDFARNIAIGAAAGAVAGSAGRR